MRTSSFLRCTAAALLVALAQCSGDSTSSGGRSPAAVSAASGDQQSGIAGAALAQPLTVTVTDAKGRPVSGAQVSFQVTAGGGSVSPASATTGADGTAQAVWTLGPSTGPQTVQASVAGTALAVEFHATATPGAAASVSLTPDSVRFGAIGDTMRLQAVARDAHGNAVSGVSFVSLDTITATVTAQGTVRARNNGTARIVATAGGVADTTRVVVRQVVAAVSVSPPADTLHPGDFVQLAAVPRDSNGVAVSDALVTWTTTDANVATVSITGLVTAHNSGSATITATAGGVTGGSAILVRPAVASVRVQPDSAALVIGDSVQFTLLAYDAGGNPLTGRSVTWSSSNPNVATVSGSGMVRGTGAGTAWIYGTSEGVRDSARVRVTAAPTRFVQVSTGKWGSEDTCALDAAGLAYCWGQDYGSVPVPISPTLTFVRVSTGANNTGACGLRSTGQVYCWTAQGGYVPAPAAQGVAFASIDWAGEHGCGLTAAGQAYCWGANNYGQLGVGSLTSSSAPVPVAGGYTWRSITAGYQYSCGVTTDGTGYCWGLNDAGQLGNPTTAICDNGKTCSQLPRPVLGGLAFRQISANSHTCGVTTDGRAFCWGPDTPAQVGAGIQFDSVATGYRHACGIATTGQAYCWGSEEYGQLGNGVTAAVLNAPPALVSGGYTWAVISPGYRHTCGVTTQPLAYCWGANYAGQLGTGDQAPSSVPRKVAGQP